MDEIIDSISTCPATEENIEILQRLGVAVNIIIDDNGREFVDGVGIPIGNYVSQYDGNFNLSVVDHWLKEVKGVKYYFRYMDDMVIFGSSKLRKQLLEANGGHTEADLQRELSRKSKLLDAYLDGILNKQEYQKKAEELDERIIQLKAETEKNKANAGDIAEIDKVLANIDEEVARYVDGNEKLKVEYLLEHLEQVQIFPDKVIVIVPILSEGIVVEKTQYVSREKRSRKNHYYENVVGLNEADLR